MNANYIDIYSVFVYHHFMLKDSILFKNIKSVINKLQTFLNINNSIDSDKSDEDVFVVIIMSHLGDALVGNGLFQNIKRIYPNSKTVFIINKPYYELAKYQKDVDEVYVYDKDGEYKGFWGPLPFSKNFPYKNIKYVFKMCRKERADMLAFFLRPKKIINYNADIRIPSHKRYCDLLKKVTKEPIIYPPAVYNATDAIPEKFQNILAKNKNYIMLCTVSSEASKDMPIQTATWLINKLNDIGYEVIFVGLGERCEKYANELEDNNCKFINLVNGTSIYELSQVLRNCKCLISVDTGTMHLGYANSTPTVCIFYLPENIIGWAPDKTVYPHTLLPENNTPQSIYDACIKLIEENKK